MCAAATLSPEDIAVSIVTYRDPAIMGRWVTGTIEIARHVLADRFNTLATMVHEASHFVGGDGAVAHIATMESLWTALARRWHRTAAVDVEAA